MMVWHAFADTPPPDQVPLLVTDGETSVTVVRYSQRCAGLADWGPHGHKGYAWEFECEPGQWTHWGLLSELLATLPVTGLHG